jgi:hypothetical protein
MLHFKTSAKSQGTVIFDFDKLAVYVHISFCYTTYINISATDISIQQILGENIHATN